MRIGWIIQNKDIDVFAVSADGTIAILKEAQVYDTRGFLKDE